jgi:hypothetical protein
MIAFFIYLCCVAFVCFLSWAGPTLWKHYAAHREYVERLERDNRYKDERIKQLQLALSMTTVARNMAETVAQHKAMRKLRLVKNDTPALLRPQAE